MKVNKVKLASELFYINQLRTPSFPIGLVTTESGFIFRSVETGLGR